MNPAQADYSNRLVQLRRVEAGEWDTLAMRQFDGDVQTHALFDLYYSEMQATFKIALNNAIALWGPPAKHFDWSHAEADDWLGRTGVSFLEIALWPHEDQFFYVLISHEDRECPIAVAAGITEDLPE